MAGFEVTAAENQAASVHDQQRVIEEVLAIAKLSKGRGSCSCASKKPLN